MATYSLSIVGVLLVCLLSIVLAVYSGSSKGRAKRSPDPFCRRTTTTCSTASIAST